MNTVTIDLADTDRIWRILHYLENNFAWGVEDESADHLAEAILKTVQPPKPDEPTGLYARVEDGDGRVWVRTALQASVWRRESVNSVGLRYLIPQDGCEDYAAIDTVRVLSEGVTDV